MDQELAVRWDRDEGMVSDLSARDGHRRFRLRTGMAHDALSAFFKVAPTTEQRDGSSFKSWRLLSAVSVATHLCFSEERH